jgi:hypothetical protein
MQRPQYVLGVLRRGRGLAKADGGHRATHSTREGGA